MRYQNNEIYKSKKIFNKILPVSNKKVLTINIFFSSTYDPPSVILVIF